MFNLKKAFYDARNQILSDIQQVELKEQFARLNEHYHYFSTEEEITKALHDFIIHYNFFVSAQSTTENKIETKDLFERAYKATVLFGGQGIKSSTLERVLIELNNGKDNSLGQLINALFSGLIITPKTKDLDLSFWRTLINGQNPRKALSIFSVSSALAEKFGPSSQGGYSLALTKTYPSVKNSREGVLYIHTSRTAGLFGYAYKENPSGTLIRGTIAQSELSFSEQFNEKFQDKSWKGGEYSPDFLDTAQEDALFSVVNKSITASKASTEILRLRTLSDMEMYHAKLTYKRFVESPELAVFCLNYKISEHVFNRCLELLKKPKNEDTIPDIYVNGADFGHEGFHLVKLPAHDYHAFFLGYIVNCCQSMGRAAEQVVLDGWSMSDRGFYVLVNEHKPVKGIVPTRSDLLNPNNGRIIGQCYAWRSDLDNLVIDSWDNLMHEHDLIAEKMLRSFAQLAVDDSQYKVFRVTVGASGGKTPPALKAIRTAEPESTSTGLHHKDSRLQAEISTRDVQQWEQNLGLFLAGFPSLSEQKQQELKESKQRSVYYQDMLQIFLSDPTLLDYVNKQKLPMKSFTALYILLRKQPEQFGALVKKTLELIPSEQLSTHRMHINILFISRFIIGASIQKNPLLFAEIAALLPLINSCSLSDLEQLFIALQNTKNTSFLSACALNCSFLNGVLTSASIKTRQALILEKRSGKNILYNVASQPELLQALLSELSEDSRVLAISERGRNDKPLLHFAIQTPESIRVILNTYPKKARIAAVQQVFGGERLTVMHLAMQYPESFKTILDCLEDQNACLAAVSKRSKNGDTVLSLAMKNPELVAILSQYLPAAISLDLAKSLNQKEDNSKVLDAKKNTAVLAGKEIDATVSPSSPIESIQPLSKDEVLRRVENNKLSVKSAVLQYETLFEIEVIKKWLEKVVDSIKLLFGKTITSNRFIFWETISKKKRKI